MSAPSTQDTEILLIDDHTLFREGLSRMLEAEGGFHVCGNFSTAESALRAIREGCAFDVGLVDYELAGTPAHSNGLDLIMQIREVWPHARILVLTGGMETSELVRAVQELRVGIFLKSEPMNELIVAITRTARGDRWISSGAALQLAAAQNVQPPAKQSAFTDRERLVLQAILEGFSNKEIGTRLSISESMVKAIVQKLFDKTAVRTRSQLVRYAIEAQAGDS